MKNYISKIFILFSISLLFLICSGCSVKVNNNIPAIKKVNTYNKAVIASNKWLENKNNIENFYEAEEIFLEIIKNDENDIQAIIALGQLYKLMWEKDFRDNTEFFEKAVDMFTKAYELEPQNSTALLNLVELYSTKWSIEDGADPYFDLTEEYCDKLILVSNDTTEKAFANKVLCSMYEETYRGDISNDKMFEKAEKAYEAYSIINGDSSEIHSDLGDLYVLKWHTDTSNMKYFDLAEDEYNIAIEKDPNNDMAYAGIGNIYASRSGKDRENKELYDKSIKNYEKAVSLAPNNESYKMSLLNIKNANNENTIKNKIRYVK